MYLINKNDSFYLGGYLVLAIILLPFLSYNLDNTDFFQYLSIAEKYASGNFSEAINSYWSPLLSWLLAPIFKFTEHQIEAFWIVQIIIGAVCLISISSLLNIWINSSYVQNISKLLVVCYILSFVYRDPSPDLLFATLIIIYVKHIIVSPPNAFNGIIAGVLGSLLYFTKSYGFYFFLTHYILVHFIFLIKDENKKAIIKPFSVGLLTFLLISGAWVGILSLDNNKITISSTGNYNFCIGQNNVQSNSSFHPINKYPIVPKNSTLSAWEDPSSIAVPNCNPLGSFENFELHLQVILLNIKSVIHFFFGKDYGLLVIFFAFIVLLKFKPKLKITNPLTLLFLSGMLYLTGYILILVTYRYLYFIEILIIIFLAYITDFVISQRGRNLKTAKIVFAVCCLAALMKPLKVLTSDKADFRPLKEVKNQIKSNDNLQGRFVALYNKNSLDSYSKSSFISQQLKIPFYGTIKENKINEGIEFMRKNRVELLYVYSPMKLVFKDKFINIYSSQTVDIYQLKVN